MSRDEPGPSGARGRVADLVIDAMIVSGGRAGRHAPRGQHGEHDDQPGEVEPDRETTHERRPSPAKDEQARARNDRHLEDRRELYAEVEASVEVEPAREFTLKGFRQPMTAYNVVAVREPAGDVSAVASS